MTHLGKYTCVSILTDPYTAPTRAYYMHTLYSAIALIDLVVASDSEGVKTGAMDLSPLCYIVVAFLVVSTNPTDFFVALLS